MQSESPELSVLSLFAIVSFFIALVVQKIFSKKTNYLLIDQDYDKPQAFHNEAIPRCGGLAAIISFTFFLYLDKIFFSYVNGLYFFLPLSMFLIGFADDLKVKISPNKRLLAMIIFLGIFINIFSLNIERVDLQFLNYLFESIIFKTSFVLICFLFIVNGSNLIDGFNGLLSLHLIIINFFLLTINLDNNNINFSILLIAQIIILTIFLLFNFPKAKIFMGDGGSYFFGSLTSLNIIYSNNLNLQISSFYFCILLFYLFFEVFFSFFRKLIQNKSPLKPDDLHLHMIIFKYLKINRDSIKSNYYTSILINLFYFLVVSLMYFFKDNGTFCKLIFFLLPVLYIAIYYKILKKYQSINEK